MQVLGTSVTGQDLIKILPGLFAILAALVRLIPTFATSARSRRSHVLPEGQSPMRIAEYAALPPFTELFSRQYHPATDDIAALDARDAMRKRTLRLCATGSLVTAILTVVYVVYGLRLKPLPNWSLLLALILGLSLNILLLRTYLAVRGDPARATAAKTQEGRLLIAARETDAKQHTLAPLVDLGARLVHVTDSTVLAATGVSFGKNMWMGELIWVKLTKEAGGCVSIVIRSTKTDFVSRSRSRRNVLSFLESFATFPGGPLATPES